MTTITLRDYDVSDEPLLAALARDTFIETFGHLYSAEDLAAHLANKCSPMFFEQAMQAANARCVIAWEGALAVGYIKWGAVELPVKDEEADAREIHRLYVRASHQASGVGAQLIERALKECAGTSAIYLGVWEHNAKAQRFYTRYGFGYVGEHVYYVGSQADRDFIWRKTA